MKLVQTREGLEATLKPAGLQRFTGAAFFSFWLTFLAFGEVFVIYLLVGGAWALITGRFPRAGQNPLETGPTLAIGLFLLCWLAFWTLGGSLAGQEWLRLLLGRDRVLARRDGIELNRGFGLFQKREFFAWPGVLRIYRPPSGTVLKLETAEGVREITRLGTAADQSALQSALNAANRHPASLSPTGLLPGDWRELPPGEFHRRDRGSGHAPQAGLICRHRFPAVRGYRLRPF